MPNLSAPARTSRRRWLGAIVVVLGLALIVAAGVAIIRARNLARAFYAEVNLRHIGYGLASYANDNRGWFPETADGLSARLAPLHVDASMFTSPRAPSSVQDSYIYRPGAHEPLNPQQIVAYENPQYVPGSHIPVLFADGRIEQLSREELNRRLQNAGQVP